MVRSGGCADRMVPRAGWRALEQSARGSRWISAILALPLAAAALMLMPVGAMAKTPARVSIAADESTSLSTSLSGADQSGPSITVPGGTAVSDQATLAGADDDSATGSVTYTAYSDSSCTTQVAGGFALDITTPGTLPSSGAVTLAPGTYYWVASYSGDENNDGTSSMCGEEVETVLPEQGTGADLSVSESLLTDTDISFNLVSMNVTVTNSGPVAAVHVLALLHTPNNALISDENGQTHGRFKLFYDASLAPGASVTFPVIIFMTGNPGIFDAVTLSLGTPDPNYKNNFESLQESQLPPD